VKIKEIIVKPKAPLTPDQARIKALKDQVKRSQDAVRAERARQKIKSANTNLAISNLPKGS